MVKKTSKNHRKALKNYKTPEKYGKKWHQSM
jgi:hypothetical protein